MGLSTKQVSSDGLDWSQTFQLPKPPAPATAKRQPPQNGLQPPPEQLKCPRCESTNTKFCYYNNYNKTQPRHFCRACKRHWTKGGTLRNVPVGGGRKNKRLRKSSNTPASAATATAANSRQLAIDQDHKVMPQPNFYQHSLDNNNSSSSNNNNLIFSSSLPFVHQSGSISFPFSSSISTTNNSSSFDANLSSISTSLQSSNVYKYAEDQFKSSVEEATITSVMPSVPQPFWKSPAASAAVDVYSNDWNWEDIETLVSADINLPWENNSDAKP